MKKRNCKMCKAPIVGRADKVFCSTQCKSRYHHTLRKVTHSATARIDSILHRNRSILLEIMGKNKRQIKLHRDRLDQKKFNFHYFTAITINSKNKTYFHVYDFRYMMFSDHEVLIIRNPEVQR